MEDAIGAVTGAETGIEKETEAGTATEAVIAQNGAVEEERRVVAGEEAQGTNCSRRDLILLRKRPWIEEADESRAMNCMT